jgi:glycosyltransferase involved in cell wall biosynthesis
MTNEIPIQPVPLFSVVVATYNDWSVLGRCLQSLSQQTGTPSFEVIVADDGSTEPAPEPIRDWGHHYSLTITRQAHGGISVARNRGIQASRGSVLLFIDADCRLEPDCLANLARKLGESPGQSCFQLRLVGDRSNQVGRAEHLRLTTLQDYLVQADGHIRYLNTAGFAIRRAKVSEDGNLFNPSAIRAEDTLLLATLLRLGELPVYVPDATVQHAIPLSLTNCFRKDIRSAYVERRAYGLIAAKGVTIQLTNRERVNIMASMWKTARQESIGRTAWVIVVGRQFLRLVVSILYRLSHWPKSSPSLEWFI